MEYTQEQIDVLNEEREKELQLLGNDITQETLDKATEAVHAMNKQAAKQLLMELMMLKQKAYGKGTLVTSVLIVQIKQVLRGLMTKYNDAGLLIGENVTLRLSDKSKHASIGFVYSPGLQLLVSQIMEEVNVNN